MKHNKTLKNSVMLRCILLFAALCIFLSVFNYFGYRNALLARYQAYITDLLVYAASNIDVDDMKECLETGEKSEKYEKTQKFFDNIKDTHKIDYIYVIIPQNTEPTDNIMNVIAGMSSYEKEYVPENEVQLGGLTGTDYTAETAEKYYNAMDRKSEIVFLQEWAERWGLEYTGILSLYDSGGHFFAELCVDVPVPEIRTAVSSYVLTADLIVLLVGTIFIVILLIWMRRAVTNPIQVIEANVVDLAERSHGQTDPNELLIDMPDIRTGNELQSLAAAIERLSRNMRDYLINAIKARDDAQAARQRAMEMSEQATRDSLTGIRNRHAYETEAKKLEWRIGAENFTRFGIAVVDLNYLKRINDTHGHEKGNQAIIKMCTIVCKVFSHSPVFRVGGDEFVVILENEDYAGVDDRIAEFNGILKKLEEDPFLEPWEKVSAAAGWSLFDPETDKNVESVYKRADVNMYENKKQMKGYCLRGLVDH